ncbi:S-adenosyl-L-methionine-dependent methyltransferase [Wolfiporia cocos MD-104 SS10]|uniref:DNA (cytosine-5-)-methyltransferase n=1 Tax=Wolfiporia cocos (strain MD-104) TaxID=742152 RepID=A0A2H3J7R2_WOLCO|nr:S-adenosyl-L-methionine-dependent methyltransferase [Wolfiporia cocos MD-104 SS10]
MPPRLNAFQVSFPDEAGPSSSLSSQTSLRPRAHGPLITAAVRGHPDVAASGQGPKRKERDDHPLGPDRQPKQVRTDWRPSQFKGSKSTRRKRALWYSPNPKDVREKRGLRIPGEDFDDNGADGHDVPVRILSKFCVFESGNEKVVPLSDDNINISLEAAGAVAPYFANEEDAGQEDDIEDSQPLRLRTTAILRYTIDYTKADDPIWIQTEFAWYILREPSKIYKQCWLETYRPHRIAQIMISAAKENPEWTYKRFRETYAGRRDRLLRDVLDVNDFEEHAALVADILSDHEDGNVLKETPILRRILQNHLGSQAYRGIRAHVRINGPPPVMRHLLRGNIDLVVLRPENQNRTHVTPLIDRLSLGLFQEHLEVVGARTPAKRDIRRIMNRGRSWLIELLSKQLEKLDQIPKLIFPYDARIRDEYWNAVEIDGVRFSVGDVIVIPAGHDNERHRPPPPVPETLDQIPITHTFADYFWFAIIVWINQKEKQVHIRYLEHSFKTLLEEIGDPQELFLSPTCGDIDLREMHILGKINVHWSPDPDAVIGPSELFCRYVYDEVNATITHIGDPADVVSAGRPPDNCPVCARREQADNDADVRAVRDSVICGGITYHKLDFVLINSHNESGPADIGQILAIDDRALCPTVLVRRLGRISNIIHICPQNIIKDERHLFLTDEKQSVSAAKILQCCHVLHRDSPDSLQEWLDMSPSNFYIQYCFPTLTPQNWGEKRLISWRDVGGCIPCSKEYIQRFHELRQFQTAYEVRPLRAFDPFGGVGAFGKGLEESGCIKFTHAVEISPSAARALRENSPHTIVYNQCANIVLQYAIKRHAGHDISTPTEIDNSNNKLPEPPKPEDIDVLVAGFPCQPHSRLNMFQRANDRKCHLMLNLLSWIDFLRPRYIFLENVQGFLSFNLNATQAGRYRVEGGIEKGGLKFVIQALLTMDYQVRFGLLQAGHYGTPQTRVRFFLIAARKSLPLSPLPKPTHAFPVKDRLIMRFPNGGQAQPIPTTNGMQLHQYVSVEDAISDLPRFHWKNPYKILNRNHRLEDDAMDVEDDIPSLLCDPTQKICGFSGRAVNYHSDPVTSFQAKCRAKPLRDLQHFTRVLKEETVERVTNIPLRPRADYRDLPDELWEWQVINPASATARNGFHPGFYGRLDQKQWFNATVTNVEPTAKQSWVLNPYCKRMVTVRELARSQGFPDCFTFYSKYDDVKTMHRQIGNAVPWPVATALGHEFKEALFEKWRKDRHEAEVID